MSFLFLITLTVYILPIAIIRKLSLLVLLLLLLLLLSLLLFCCCCYYYCFVIGIAIVIAMAMAMAVAVAVAMALLSYCYCYWIFIEEVKLTRGGGKDTLWVCFAIIISLNSTCVNGCNKSAIIYFHCTLPGINSLDRWGVILPGTFCFFFLVTAPQSLLAKPLPAYHKKLW